MASAQRGSPSPSPTPSPNARCSGGWRLRMSNGLPSLTVPRHTTKTTIKKRKSARRLRCKTRLVVWPRTRARPNIYFKTRPAHCRKNEGSAKSTARYHEPSSSALPGQLPAFRQAHTPATPPLTKTSFQATSPRQSPHTSGDRQQRLPAASRVTVKRPYERFWEDGGV